MDDGGGGDPCVCAGRGVRILWRNADRTHTVLVDRNSGCVAGGARGSLPAGDAAAGTAGAYRWISLGMVRTLRAVARRRGGIAAACYETRSRPARPLARVPCAPDAGAGRRSA